MEGKRFLVVPSCRPYGFIEFMAAWKGRGGWDSVILVEDAPSRTESLTPLVDYHFSHAEIEGILGDSAWIISRRDSAIRCFGFLAAYHLNASHVLTLDDDTRPEPDETNFFGRHLQAFASHQRWVSTVPGVRVRGLPYQNAGRLTGIAANMGLWSWHADLDAITSLTRLATEDPPDIILPKGNVIIPRGQYAPICGMNLCLSRESLPLWYFPLQGEGYPFRRMDDIWCGILAKKCADHLGYHISVGKPWVEHRRASDPFVNLVKEGPGVVANETFWEEIDQIKLPAYAIDPVTAVDELGQGLASRGSTDYVRRLGGALRVWAGLFTSPLPGLSESPPEAAAVQT